MYSVSAEFLSAMQSPAQKHKIEGTIGSVPFTSDNIVKNSFSITNQISDGNEIGIGKVYVGELTATFCNVSISDGEWKNKVITPAFYLYTENGWESVPLGIFVVSEATISASGVSVRAYDYMTKFDRYCTSYHGAGGGSGVEGSSSVVWGKTAYNVIMAICRRCGVEFDMSRAQVAALPNGSMNLELFEDNDITTYRDMLSWIAQTLACNATIDRGGRLVLVPFRSTSDYTFDSRHRHVGATFKDFETRITELWIDSKPMEMSYSYTVTPNNGLSYEMGQNPYLQIGTAQQRDDAMNAILSSLQNVKYTPFDVSLTGCPIFDLGDIITFTDGILSNSKKGCITAFTYTFNAAYSLSCGGKNPAEAKAKSASDKRMDGMNSSISSQKSTITVVRNADSVSIGDGNEVTVLEYPFEVTDSVNLTNVSTQIILQTEATETVVGDVYTIGDIVARAVLYLDNIEIGDIYPEFVIGEGTDTINFDYALKNLTVGPHTYKVALELNGGDGEVDAEDVHEFLWGNGITFEVYLKYIQVVSGKSAFRIGTDLDTSDWHVRGINNNGTIVPTISDWTTDPADGTRLDEAGEMDVEVMFENISTEYPIEVVYAPYDGCKVFNYDNYIELFDENGAWERVRYMNGATTLINDHEILSQAGSGGSVRYQGRDNMESSSTDESISGYIQGAKNGYVYSSVSGNERTFHRVIGNSMEGDISEEVIGSYTFEDNNLFAWLCPGAYTGTILPFVCNRGDGTYYGYVDTKAGVVVPDMFSVGITTFNNACCRLENGDVYIIVGDGVEKHMHAYVNGAHHHYDISSIDSLDVENFANFYYGLYHDASANCLVLYICKFGGQSDLYKYINTHCYKLLMDGHTVLSQVSLPSYLDVPVDPNASDIAYYEQATAFRVWMNGSNLNTYYPDTVDGIRLDTFHFFLWWDTTRRSGTYNGKPFLYVDFSGNDYAPLDRQYLIGSTYSAGVHNLAQRMVYIDNLYMQDSAGNVVKEW